MALIDHTNYSTTLKQSTNPRDAAPNGNIYFDAANNRIQLIASDELPMIDLGAGLVPNPLTVFDGITMRALYNFENSCRRVDENLRKYKRGIDGDYRFAGAYSFINGVKLDGSDRRLIRSSGFIEYAAIGDGMTNVDRVYHGVVSLVDMQADSVPYYALVSATDEATLQAATWINFQRLGDINEVIQVYGSTANGDAEAGNFDYKTRTLVVRVRSWGYNPGETTSIASGISEFSGNSAGYGVGESLNPQNTYDIADVYGGAQVAPWTGMSLEKLAVAQIETGFNESDGSFTWVLHNLNGGTVAQCAAFLDALSLQDSDIDDGAASYNGKKGRVWYTRNAAGKVVTSSIGGAGLFIEGLSTAEKQNIIMIDDAGTEKTYPYFPDVQISVGAAAVADPNAWYQVFYADGAGGADFDTSSAVTVNNAAGDPIKGNVQDDHIGGKIIFAYAYDTNTQAGLPAGTDKNCVVVVEGDGIAAQAITYFTITRSAIVSVTCAPSVENNA